MTQLLRMRAGLLLRRATQPHGALARAHHTLPCSRSRSTLAFVQSSLSNGVGSASSSATCFARRRFATVPNTGSSPISSAVDAKVTGTIVGSSTKATDAHAAASATGKDVDNVKIDLSTVGAETTRVLTIADVLNTREQQFANGPTSQFDEWESISGSQNVFDAIELMVKRNMRSLIVTEESSGIVGIITERDILKKTSPRTVLAQETAVRDIMSSHIMCVPPTTTVIDALATMTKENIRHLAVINGELTNMVKIGSVPEEAMRCVLSIKDIVKAYAEFEAEKKQALASHQTAQDGAEATPVTSEASTIDGAAPSSSQAASATTADAAPAAAPAATPAPPNDPVVTAATLLKKKHKKIKLILNTREEDNISVADAVESMARQNFGAVLIVDKDQRVLGIFTERDYLAKVLYHKGDPTKIRMVDVSTRNIACLQIEDTLEKCWDQAATQDFRHFPVIGVMRKDREKELAGILSIKDIVREISKEHHTTPGFRLFDFFKSKMEPKVAEAPPAPSAPMTPVAPASSEEKATPAKAAKPQSTDAPQQPPSSESAASASPSKP
uniref:CBS domain-containing protein n=1 Tax=Globisporangium ultimum (strain ATCC 200006 / CBS 805.95 / DAOM BR144) TaxID=431595 RepID=K3W5B0_GLOUD